MIDLDHYNLGTITRVDAYSSGNLTSDSEKPYLHFYTHLINLDPNGRRSAMWGYAAIISTWWRCQYSANVQGADIYSKKIILQTRFK